MRAISLLPWLVLPLAAQSVPTEEEVIAAGRKAGSQARPVAGRGPLLQSELNLVRQFKAVKGSVVHIGTAVLAFDERTQQTQRVAGGLGTGFVWDDLGHVVTNNHVISAVKNGDPSGTVDEVQVKLANGRTYKARVIGRSLTHDIAVLQVFAPLKELRPLPLGRSGDLQVGQGVMAIGNPFGLDHSLTTGVVSALDRTIETDLGTPVPGMIQTDAAINPGNSGGPLLDSAGRVVGMNTAITTTSGSSAGIGFAIPVDTLNRVVPHLIARGGAERPKLGFISAADPSVPSRLGVTTGVLVWAVEPDSLAALAGLRGCEIDYLHRQIRRGDVILKCNGREIRNEADLVDYLSLDLKGDRIVFLVEREGKQVEVTLDLKARPRI